MTTTKRRGSNAINTGAKSKRSRTKASISGSANGNRTDATDGHDGDSSSGENPLLASERGSQLLEPGADNSADNGVVVSGEGVELEMWETGKIEWSEEEIKEINRLKSASECVFEVGDRYEWIGEGSNRGKIGTISRITKNGNIAWQKDGGFLDQVISPEMAKISLSKEGSPKLSPEFEKKFGSNFGRKPKAEANGQLNLLESEEDDGEAPDPDDFDNLEEFKTAWDSWAAAQFDEIEEEISHITAEEIWNQSTIGNGSICVQESGPDSPTPGLNCGGDRPITSVSETNIAGIFSASDTLMHTSTEMLTTTLNVEQISSQLPPPVNHSQLMESDSEEPTNEIVSPQFSQQFIDYSPNSQSSKTSEDSSPVQSDQEAIAYTSLESLTSFPTAGTMLNGNLSAADTLPPLGIGEESLLLRSPGALSSTGNGRPPGTCKLDHQLQELGLIATGEVTAPEFLEAGYQLPQGFSNPNEMRTALELSQVQAQQSLIAPNLELPPATAQTAIAVQPSEMLSIGELPLWDSSELSTLQALSEELNLGALNKDELLAKALDQHQAITSIEREEFNLALIKLYRVRLAGLCLQEFKRRCKHGEFEGSLESVKLKPRSAQNYMVIAKNWDLIESKAQQISLLEQGQTLGLNWALEAVRDAKRSLKSAAPSDPDNWRTPDTIEQPILFLVKQALGIITVDVCADDAKSVKALVHYTKADDGLSKEWEGYIFMNPPFSNPLPWIQKLCFFRARGDVRGAIALLKAGTINNQGTGELISKHASAICNWRGRIAFLNEDGEPVKGADFDCVLVYFGKDPLKFEKVFSPWGTVSLIGQALAQRQLPPTVNNQQLTIKQEETEAAKALGLSNGKSVLPDLRDSDRAISESHDPHTVSFNVLPQISYEKSEDDPTNGLNNEEVKNLYLNDYITAVSSNIGDFGDSQLKFLVKIAKAELNRRHHPEYENQRPRMKNK